MQFLTIPGCFHKKVFQYLKKKSLLLCLSWIKISNHFSYLLRKKPANYFPVEEGVASMGWFFCFVWGLFGFNFLVLFWGFFWFFVFVVMEVFCCNFLCIWRTWAGNGIPNFPIVFPAEISALPVILEKYLDVRFLLASANVKMWVMYQWPWYASRGHQKGHLYGNLG